MKPCDILLEHLRQRKTAQKNLKSCTQQPPIGNSHINFQKTVHNQEESQLLPNLSLQVHPLIHKSFRDNLRQQSKMVPDRLLIKKFTGLHSLKPKKMPTIFEIPQEHNEDNLHEEDERYLGWSTIPQSRKCPEGGHMMYDIHFE